jgi:hypothetical protein
MKLKNQLINALSLGILVALSVGCNNDDDVKVETFNGTLTVLQKDAYSDAPGRTSELWPPHTTIVFKWSREDGTVMDSSVQLNHGTMPGATNSQGEVLLIEVKKYSFSGTQIQMEALQSAFDEAICDDGTRKFLDLAVASSVIEETLLEEVTDFVFGDENFACSGTVNKDSVIAFFEAGDIHKVVAELSKCNWTKEDWLIAFEAGFGKVVGDLGQALEEYHVCNNDAAMQVELIKTFMSTGEVVAPIGDCAGLEWYFVPD